MHLISNVMFFFFRSVQFLRCYKRREHCYFLELFVLSVWASSPIWRSYPIIWSNKQAPRDHTLVDVSSCLCWMCYTAISSFCLFFIWAWGGSICWKLILSHLVGYWLVINCLFCDLLLLTLLKPAKENMREEEEKTEKPGLVQCKVIVTPPMVILVLITIIDLMRINLWPYFYFLPRIYFHLHFLYDFCGNSTSILGLIVSYLLGRNMSLEFGDFTCK